MNLITPEWHRLLYDLLHHGDEVAPRGKPTLELPQRTIAINMRTPVLISPSRRLNYKFMAAEAYWILTGDNRVENIAPYNPNIAQFSDNGETFFGAYGPPIQQQLPYVLAKLKEDPLSRQAGLTIWRQSPPATKDVPCTVAIFATIRDQVLRLHAFMRSSDAWLGVPYDLFSFSMLSHMICSRLNHDLAPSQQIVPGELHLTMASSHLYSTNFDAAKMCLQLAKHVDHILAPAELYQSTEALLTTLGDLRTSKPGHYLRWWEGSR